MDGNATNVLLQQIIDLISQSTVQTFDIARDEILTADEVSTRLKFSKRALQEWIKQGKFPQPIQMGGKKVWTSSLINNYVYEENPQLRDRDRLLSEARRISGDAE